MRIDSNHRFPSSTLRKSQQNDLLFEAVLKDAAKQEEEKQGDKKGRLVTAREGEYIRQYIVRPDGSRVLLSEAKQTFETEAMGNDPSAPNEAQPVQSGMSQNTKDMIGLLNFQVGAGITFTFNKQAEKSE
ncbi:hypothetical protein WJ0W_003602 [Paenibacillus melissococcoides]|uniref:Uncharacterized protein n=1 Tax=Paenibacillus melissococcoides TaxID=2912268 RepID=A0ABM9G434_9BACL|nr:MULTISPECIES: hypothetical protein [Paenibacillus]MEB9895615.1 hypothetical protein [Bacillus cereus]CAH8246367.1 hypothetical protein WJ0W_003602 [Paenibacillus melissococcoides]CAH8714532.1 hypothetical protein HTL2_003974 [Paenibacillus melissococcoides]CAH8715488.1 hypothetical protein WDD9_004241 [Paenibacillus melissococcoides]GIO78182.1 hypothetical protein J6TS7_17920 [Paenibacillus dendritiformis]